MKKLCARLAMTLLLGALFALPAMAQLQYFGYVGAADDDVSLGKTKGYTNFAHIGTSGNIYDPFVIDRLTALSQRGMKATIDLGQVLWCDYDGDGHFRYLCNDWVQRWNNWKAYNASVLTPDKVLAMTVRDEPLIHGASMADYDLASGRVKTDLPWVKLWMVEGACLVAWDNCGVNAYQGKFNAYTGGLPYTDWIGVDIYSVHPATDSTLQAARNKMKAKFPGKKWLYVADGWWAYNDAHANAFYPNGMAYMSTIAREWYDYARNDPDAVLLGVFIWPTFGEGYGSVDLPCNVLQEHGAIGRAITGKARPPIGTFSIDNTGVLTGWTCDPDQAVCDANPLVRIYIDGVANGTFYAPLPANDTFTNLQCGMDKAYRFKVTLPRSSSQKTVTLTATDGGSTSATIASTCAQSPGCSWTSHLKYFGYVGSGDDTQNRGLDQTKGFTNFSHIATPADLASTFVRDRVTAMSQRGVQATIDLGLVLWCGSGGTATYGTLCANWAQRWETWKVNNATILTSDKVLGFTILDGPFGRNANMTHYDTAAAKVKTDFPWAKTLMFEAACVVKGQCGTTTYTSFTNYTGGLPNVDWVGLSGYGIHPATDSTYQSALTKLKNKFPSKPRTYVMDAYWDPSAHGTVFGNISSMRSIAREWYDVAHNDPGAILLGAFIWAPLSGTTTARDFSCTVLSEHRDIGREITRKTRPKTGAPVGLLENIYDGSGLAIGYACDPDGTICEDPRIDFYADGAYSGTGVNYPSRNDFVVNAQCGVGVAYRFRQTMSQGASGRNVTAVARDLDTGSTALPSNCAENPACLWYTTAADPKGYMEVISPSGIAAGWVCDPDAPHVSTKVRLATGNGTLIGVFPTNLNSEQAVADECGGGYLHRFSVQLPAWARNSDIYAYAQDTVSGEVQIPWLCEQGWYCPWY